MKDFNSNSNGATRNYFFLDRQKMSLVNDLILENQETGGKAMKNLIKIKRWEAGLKQYELAFLLGCSAPYLSMVENNRVDATEEFKHKAAELFGMNTRELFSEAVA